MTENQLLEATLSLAKVYGWRTLHIRQARTEKGWRSPVQGDGKGFPDLLMCRADRMLAVELKGDTGHTTPEQEHWLYALDLAGAECWCWRPSDWHDGSILAALKATPDAELPKVRDMIGILRRPGSVSSLAPKKP